MFLVNPQSVSIHRVWGRYPWQMISGTANSPGEWLWAVWTSVCCCRDDILVWGACYVYRARNSGASAFRNLIVSQNSALKSWVSFLFSNCSELQCSLLLFASLLTAVSPHLKLCFRAPLSCSVAFSFHRSYSVLTQRTCKGSCSSYHFFLTQVNQGDGVEVKYHGRANRLCDAQGFLGKSNIHLSCWRQDAKAFRDASHFRTRRVPRDFLWNTSV